MKLQDVKHFEIFKCFEKKLFLTAKFSKFCFETPIDVFCANYVKFGRREIVKSSIAYLTKKNKISPGSSAVATERIAPNICQGQPPTMYSEFSRFHYNRFTFGQVIAECVNTTKPRRKVNPIFD